MNCTKCNAALADDAIFCPECGDQFAVNEQRAKVSEAFANTKNLIVKQLKTPIFLVVAILFSVVFASNTINMISGGIGGVISGLLPCIFMLIATIGLWKAYTAKETAGVNKALRQASIYDAYTSVIYTIAIVLLSILGAIMFILMLLSGSLLSGAAEGLGAEEASDSLMGGGIIAAIVVLVVFAVIITIVSIFKGIYKKRRKYFVALGETAETGKYTAVKAPVIGSYVVGGVTVISAVFPIVMAFAGRAIITSLVGPYLASMGEMGDMVNDLLDSLFAGAILSSITSGLMSLVSGGYLILSAVWMANVHKAEVANRETVKVECARLEALEVATKEAVFAAEKKRRDEEDAARKAADAEAKKAQADMAAQQQQMMQMMMMQMMQQNGMMNNVAPVAEEEAPVAEEEAPAAEEEAPAVEEEAPAVEEEAPAAEEEAPAAEEEKVEETVE